MGSRKGKKGFHTPFASIAGKVRAGVPEARSAPKKEPEPPPAEAPDEAELFARAMHGVDRLPSEKGARDRVEPKKNLQAPHPTEDEMALAELERLVRGGGAFVEPAESEDLSSWRAPGVSKRTLQRLERGDIAYRRHLDLHGLSREEAHEKVAAFVAEARRDGQSCVLIITGRGLGSQQGVAVLREALPRWLSRAPLRAHVLGFCVARRVDGGPGAYYVLLRRPGIRPFGGAP